MVEGFNFWNNEFYDGRRVKQYFTFISVRHGIFRIVMTMASTKADFPNMDSDGSSSWEDVEEDGESEEEYHHPLLLNSLILEKVFEFLATTDLLTSRQVCREWNRTALLRNLLGSRFEIAISKANFDRLLKLASMSLHPFCRKFDFRLLELEYDRVSKFIKLFGDRLKSISIKFCTASSAESVIQILNCPRLEELKIYGTLPEIKAENFHSFIFTRLNVLELNSSLDYGRVDNNFISIILQHAPNLHCIQIGQSISLWTDFSTVVSPVTTPKLCHFGLSGIEAPLEINHFSNFLSKGFILRKATFQNCLVGQEFLQQFLLQTYQHLTVLIIDGTQQEILSKAFIDVRLPNFRRLTLPIDGVSISEGNYLLQSAPKLSKFTVTGLFQTDFFFQDGQLASVIMQERYLSPIFSRENLQQALVHEKRREFMKVLSLFKLQPYKLEINLVVSHINSRCLRAIYQQYPDLQHLVLVNNCTKQTLVGMTGIPYRICRRVAYCKTFSILQAHRLRLFTCIGNLKKLKSLELTILDETPSKELSLTLLLYGICELQNLQELSLTNVAMSDVAMMVLSQNLKLASCKINGSQEQWIQFQSFYKRHTIKSFLLPPSLALSSTDTPGQTVGKSIKMILKIFSNMDSGEIFKARQVCKYWHAVSHKYLHCQCSSSNLSTTSSLEARIDKYHRDQRSHSSPSNRAVHYLGESKISTFPLILHVMNATKKETTLVIISLDASVLEFFQLDNCRRVRHGSYLNCLQRRQLEYWFYPNGKDHLVYPYAQLNFDQGAERALDDAGINTLLVVGSWGRKDSALLEFFNTSWMVSTIQLIGLQKDALDIVLPKLISMNNLESLEIGPRSKSSAYCELTRTHLQILCNASFKLKQLTMQLHAPSEAVVDFVRSQRFTLETLELHCNVNLSDRLTFSIPQLKLLRLDEPPGCLLWTTLNVHSSLETINFGRSGCAYNQVKNKATPKIDSMDAEFEHSATEILCDVNWFLENATSRRTGAQKSILQIGSDSALKFFTHFPFLSSLTLRSVHAHYGILQGIFKKFTQLKKLELVNATGVTDEILTGFSKHILDEMDIMNPFQVTRDRHKHDIPSKGFVSIRNLKCLTHLSIDDQPACTDFSIIFGILKLNCLEYFSCRKWKITDIALRAFADVLPSLKEINTEGCASVSKYALEYFNEIRAQPPYQEN